jgi:hypothetical protein
MTWKFWNTYCDELYAIITEDFLRDNKNPIGVDLSSLQTDLLSTTKEKITVKTELSNIKKTTNRTNMKKKAAGSAGSKAGITGNKLSKKPAKKVAAGNTGRSGGAKGSELNKKATKTVIADKLKPATKKKGPAGTAGHSGG